ncbi:phosphoribosyl-AMP cyclohydrolase [Candidatus Nitrosacidococcus sp. I8]|uniref:phosphoribosyl-AMP cyclohydrolase n=1 Tax=Candidatus Nitrosacidococcus sp. I8 TaxID=2942908 RepID=UPI0024CB3876|nr:Phosphoribosyl-AMP cyclohydrolase [Candidatus Nitrosacidococcus sp. I8]
MSSWLDDVAWNEKGLVPVITQEINTGKVLMFAWMNRQSLEITADTGYVVYWSRSRSCLWRKGERSGHEQIVKNILLDCDNDTLLIQVEQKGGIACHTGRHHCFFKQLKNKSWKATDPILKDPNIIYGS